MTIQELLETLSESQVEELQEMFMLEGGNNGEPVRIFNQSEFESWVQYNIDWLEVLE